jgi:putative ribosome biogenesis GTPase RsgA
LKSTAPILILLNKIDLVDDEKEKNKLDNIYKNIDYSLLSEKHFLVKEISALKNKNLEESIRWLFNSMTDQEKTK